MQSNMYTERIVALVDMDCFYVQVEQRLRPEFLGKPCVVVQYNQWKGGGIIAVNYEARAFGIERRGMRGDDAKKKCPDVHLFSVPVERGKANLTRYREAGAEVMEVMCQFSSCVERASIDEAYLDLTEEVSRRLKDEQSLQVTSKSLPNTFVVGWEKPQHFEETRAGHVRDERDAGVEDWIKSSCSVNECDRRLAVAAVIVEEMRAAVYEKTTFRCSAGVAHNKVLAKLVCGLHKPNRQTVMPQHSVPFLYETIPVKKVRSLGGKLGEDVMEKFSLKMMSELSKIKECVLKKKFGEKTGSYLFQLGQGIECEPVNPRQLAKSIGCGKNIRGNTKACVQHWVSELSEELSERLFKDQKNNSRVAKGLTVSIRSFSATQSRACTIHSYEKEKIAKEVMNVLHKVNAAPANSDDWYPILTNIALSANKFQDQLDVPVNHIKSFFAKPSPSTSTLESPSKRPKLDPPCTYNCREFSPTVSALETHGTCTEIPILRTEPATISKGFFAKKMESKVLQCNTSESHVNSENHTSANSDCVQIRENKLEDKMFFEGNIADLNLNETEEISNEAVKPSTSSSAFCNSAEDDFTYTCEQCNKKIPLQDIEEHTDFHYAQTLAKEFQSGVPKNTSASSTSKTKVSVSQKKRGRPRKTETEKNSKVNMKPLEFYLK